MKNPKDLIERLVQQAFGLLLQIRARPDAGRLLREVLAFLKLVLSEQNHRGPAMVVSVGLVRLPNALASLDPEPDPPPQV